MLESRRFVTESFRRVLRLVIDALRPYLPPDDWITHNFMGWFDALDHYVLTADLDMASWDWYIGTGHHDHVTSGAAHDLTRGFKRQNFWVMETQVGHTNHLPINNVLNRGEMRATAWHAVAHGAESVLYWQWRMAPGGQDQYWGTLVDQAGKPRVCHEEVRQVGHDCASVGTLLAGTAPVANLAILNSYDARWAVDIHRHHQDFEYREYLLHYYRPLAERNIAVDILPADAPLGRERMVIAPALHLLEEGRAAQLLTYVEAGGHLVLTLRSGVKDDRNALLSTRPLGAARRCGRAEVEEYFALEDHVPVHGALFTGTSAIWAERLRARDRAGTEVIARFGPSAGWCSSQPAVTSHPWGSGRVYVVGAWLDDVSQRALLAQIVDDAGVDPVLQTPEGVDARLRSDGQGKKVLIVVNHTRVKQTVTLPWPAHDHLTDVRDVDELSLTPYGVGVFTRSSA